MVARTRSVKLYEVADFKQRNFNFKNAEYIEYLDTGSITENTIESLQRLNCKTDEVPSRAKKSVKNNTIIYSSVRPNLKHYGILKNPSSNLVVSTGFITLNPININADYLFYALTQQQYTENLHTVATNSVSSYPSINPNDLMNLRINIFDDIDEQAKIAKVVLAIDNKISLNNKINAELEQTARLIYGYWFTQFDFPDAQGKPYKSSGGAMVMSDQLKREVPAQWEVTSLRELIAVSKNGDWGKSEHGSGCIKAYCVRGADINGLNGLTSFDPPVRYIESSHTNRLLKSDDLVVEISGGSPTQSTGRMAHISKDVIDRLQGDVVCSNFCKAISLKNERLSYVVNHYWNHLYESGTFFNFEGKTSGIKNLMFDQLVKDVKIALPSDSVLIDKYYALAKVMDSQKQANLLQNEELVRLRDWLLPMLMTGQVKVGD